MSYDNINCLKRYMWPRNLKKNVTAKYARVGRFTVILSQIYELLHFLNSRISVFIHIPTFTHTHRYMHISKADFQI